MTWKPKVYLILMLLRPLLGNVWVKDYSCKPNKKYMDYKMVIFRSQAGVTYYNSTYNILSDSVVSIMDHVTGEIKVGDGSSYEKVFNVILNRCAPKSENPITNFVDKVLAGDIDKYVTNNATICPIKTGVIEINNFPLLSIHVPKILSNVKFHGTIKAIAKIRNSKKPVVINIIDFYGESYS